MRQIDPCWRLGSRPGTWAHRLFNSMQHEWFRAPGCRLMRMRWRFSHCYTAIKDESDNKRLFRRLNRTFHGYGFALIGALLVVLPEPAFANWWIVRASDKKVSRRRYRANWQGQERHQGLVRRFTQRARRPKPTLSGSANSEATSNDQSPKLLVLNQSYCSIASPNVIIAVW